MRKDKNEFVEETQDQKDARWAKQNKTARSFARQCGVDLKKIARERGKNEAEKRNRSRSQYF